MHEPRGQRRHTLRLLAVWLVFLCGCAYFNTFYNANKLFNEAEKLRTEKGGSEERAAPQYDACIKKCLDLLRYHPNSKYVDDALYMIGVSHFHRGEYVQAQASFRDLLEGHPESDFAERALFHMGLASLAMGDRGGAASAFETLERDYPDSQLKVDAAYRTAEALMEAEDNEATRQALREFISENPQSQHVGAARLRIADTYYDELRFPEARSEYLAALDSKLSDEQLYEVKLQVALTKREEAALILADPALYTEADLPPGLRLQLQGAMPDSVISALPAATALPGSLQAERDRARALLESATLDLEELRKQAQKLGVDLNLRIERAVTLALLGDPEEALGELDQIARTELRSDIGSKAQYEIGEIERRLGRWDKALEAYNAAQRSSSKSYTAELGLKKSTAIRARMAALDQLREADDVRRRWRLVQGLEPLRQGETSPASGPDSLRMVAEIERRFEEMATQLLRVAEIDLFELGQPRLALRECQQLLADYPGSSQSPRAALGIGWINATYLSETERALQAYDYVMREYPGTPQARQAREFATKLRETQAAAQEVMGPSSQP